MKKYLRKISDPRIVGNLSVCGLGVVGAVVLGGCMGENTNTQQAKSGIQEATKNGATVMIEQQSDGSYKILEEYPSSSTRVILKNADGSERILSQEEIDKIIADENKKIENGTSQLTNPTGGGLSLGETILASAAGAILGSWIGSKLFNNQNYQTQQRTSYKSPQGYERSQSSFGKNASATGAKAGAGRSGFYAPNNASSSSRDRNSSGFGG